MRGVERMSADTTAPHLLYCLDYRHQDDPCSSFAQQSRIATPLTIGRDDTVFTSRKRKNTYFEDDSDFDDDDAKSFKTDCDTKSNGSGRISNHSEIEKRRRDKMNGFISEISSLVPVCASISRKLDKLTVLRLTVQHIKSLRSNATPYGRRDSLQPIFMSDEELKDLLQKISDGFLLALSCDRGKILHVSENVTEYLGYQKDDLLGKSFVDIVHAKDISVIKQQMLCFNQIEESAQKNFSSKSKDCTVGSTSSGGFCESDLSVFAPGTKRSFFCRLKNANSDQMSSYVKCNSMKTAKGLALTNKNNYSMFYCCGFLKSWPAALSTSELSYVDNDWDASTNLNSLVLLVRKKNEKLVNNSYEFLSRLSLDANLLYVDQNVVNIVGFVSNDLVGRSYYELIHEDDLTTVAEAHNKLLENDQRRISACYRLKTNSGDYITISSTWFLIVNPWTKSAEFISIKQRAIDDLEFVSDQQDTQTTDINITKYSTLSNLLSQLPLGRRKLRKLISEHPQQSYRNYGANKSVTISTIETVDEKSKLKQSICSTKEHGFVDIRSTTKTLTPRDFHVQTAIRVSTDVLINTDGELNNNGDYSEVLWSL